MLLALYLIRNSLESASKKWPQYKRAIFFAQSLRSAVVLVFLTIGSYIYCKGKGGADGNGFPIAILKTVPRGFGQNVGVPVLDTQLISAIASKVPVATIIVFLEHVAVAKSFGRINNYKVRPLPPMIGQRVDACLSKVIPSQELVGLGSSNAIWKVVLHTDMRLGAQNVVSTFFSGYPSTGAFSRSALNSKSGVRTPLGGCEWITSFGTPY